MKLLERTSSQEEPILAVQFGEGNFIRGYIDWMVDYLRDQRLFKGRILMVKPRPGGDWDGINRQGGLYTVIERGISGGKPTRSRKLIQVVSGCLSPYESWDKLVDVFVSDELKIVFSNTTESGLVYRKDNAPLGTCPGTFPAQLASLLRERFLRYSGAPDKGLIVIPCELLIDNGTLLRAHVLRHAQDSQWGEEFKTWISEHCLFVNTLVDRIVSGYPHEEADKFMQELGYEDRYLTCVEPYYLLVMEADEKKIEEVLPFKRCWLNVRYTDDLTPWRLRKLRLLNALHTACVPLAWMAEIEDVRSMMKDPDFAPYVKRVLNDELVPTLLSNMDEEEVRHYAHTVIERFLNPSVSHKLSAISINSIDKWRERVLPALRDTYTRKGFLPERLVLSLGALLLLYFEKEVPDSEDKLTWMREQKNLYAKDGDTQRLTRAFLGHAAFWKDDLNTMTGLEELLTPLLARLLTEGSRALVASTHLK